MDPATDRTTRFLSTEEMAEAYYQLHQRGIRNILRFKTNVEPAKLAKQLGSSGA